MPQPSCLSLKYLFPTDIMSWSPRSSFVLLITDYRFNDRRQPTIFRLQVSSSAPTPDSPAAATELTHDYPQFLGPNRNSTVEAPQLAHDWKAYPPQRLWHVSVGAGWSGFAVSANHAITQEQRGEEEVV